MDQERSTDDIKAVLPNGVEALFFDTADGDSTEKMTKARDSVFNAIVRAHVTLDAGTQETVNADVPSDSERYGLVVGKHLANQSEGSGRQLLCVFSTDQYKDLEPCLGAAMTYIRSKIGDAVNEPRSVMYFSGKAVAEK